MRFTAIEALESVLTAARVTVAAMPRAGLFLAGKAFQRYRATGGRRTGVLPDLFIGAHAAVTGMTLLTRAPLRYRSYFPNVALVTP